MVSPRSRPKPDTERRPAGHLCRPPPHCRARPAAGRLVQIVHAPLKHPDTVRRQEKVACSVEVSGVCRLSGGAASVMQPGEMQEWVATETAGWGRAAGSPVEFWDGVGALGELGGNGSTSCALCSGRTSREDRRA